MRNWKFCIRKNSFRKGNIFIWLITMASCLIPGYQSIKMIYGNIIVDHTHAFFTETIKRGIDTLYSCRKFWGVSDGAYLSTDASLTENKTVDYSAERMKHILGRYEHNAGTYYKDMLENAAKYDGMELRQMSKLTQNLLKAVDYDRAKKKMGRKLPDSRRTASIGKYI